MMMWGFCAENLSSQGKATNAEEGSLQGFFALQVGAGGPLCFSIQ